MIPRQWSIGEPPQDPGGQLSEGLPVRPTHVHWTSGVLPGPFFRDLGGRGGVRLEVGSRDFGGGVRDSDGSKV